MLFIAQRDVPKYIPRQKDDQVLSNLYFYICKQLMYEKKRSNRTIQSTTYGNSNKWKLSEVSTGNSSEARSCTRSWTIGQDSSCFSSEISDPNEFLSSDLSQKPVEEGYETSGDQILLEIKGQFERLSISDPLKFELRCSTIARDHDIDEGLMLAMKIVIVRGAIKKNCLFQDIYRELMKQYAEHTYQLLLQLRPEE